MAYYEFTIRVPEAFKDRLIQRLSGTGSLGVIEGEEAIIAYFPVTHDLKAVINDLELQNALLEKAGNADRLTYACTVIPDQDWNESWKKGFTPIDVGNRFTILPPWEVKREGRINLIIDPAMAFGTGHHETTRSCLALMEKCAEQARKESFLDLGTGTGILAIAAYKLGYKRVVGLDTDPLAVDAAFKNIELNQTPGIEIREGGLSEICDSFDVIAANLISGVLVDLAGTLASHLNPGGVAILSGILQGQESDVIDAVKQADLRLTEKYPDGKWISLVVEREHEPAVAHHPGRVLIMDDEDVIREVAGAILTALGCEVAGARDGTEAIALYDEALKNRRPFDAVIMDLSIPNGMGGKEAMEKLRELDPGVKAIVSSGNAHDPVMEQFLDYGFCGAISKPFHIKTLSEMIRRVVPGTTVRTGTL